jgi:hypothetical protein
VTREYASDRKHDVATMQTYEGRNADNVWELTVSLRSVGAGVIRLLEQLDVEQRPHVARESRALRYALGEMSDAAATVEPRCHAIGQEQRVRRVLPSLPPTGATSTATAAAATTTTATATVISATVSSSVTGPAFTQARHREPSLGLTTAAEESLDEETEDLLLAQTPLRPSRTKSLSAATSGSDHFPSPCRSPRHHGPPPQGGGTKG